MKSTRLLLLLLLLGGQWLTGTFGSRAQTVDPSFYPAEIYEPAAVQDVVLLGNGGRLVLSNASRRAEGQPCAGLVRYTAAGQPDVAFNTALTALTWTPTAVAEDAAGRLLVASPVGIMLGTQSYGSLVRLLPTGALDPSFSPQSTISGSISGLLVQPDGKIVLAGAFRQYGGQAAVGLARLNADGTIDQGFMTALGTGLGGQTFSPRIVLQADGKLLVGGSFNTVAGQPRRALARLNTDGSLDASFAPAVTSTALVGALTVQPDGKIIVGTFNGTRLFANSNFILRLTSTGALDATFAAPVGLSATSNSANARNLVVMPDGSVVLCMGGGAVVQGRIVRLTSTGAYFTGWNVPEFGDLGYYTALTPLPNGQVLAAGGVRRATSFTSLPVGVALLNSDGSYNASFVPQLQKAGNIHDVAVQPDGKLIIVGSFTEVNGTPVRNLARLNADGTTDGLFSSRCSLLGCYSSVSNDSRRVLLQPDGKVLVCGDFTQVGTTARASLARLLPDGQLDLGFDSPFRPNTPNMYVSWPRMMARQADGRVLLGGNMTLAATNASASVLRVQGTTGQFDASFAPITGQYPTALLEQPDGKVVISYESGTVLVERRLANGTPDPAFTTPTTSDPYSNIYGVERYPDGRLLVYGYFPDLGGVPTKSIGRLLPNGTPDPSFVSDLASPYDLVTTAVLQPNQRVLLGGDFALTAPTNYVGLARLQPNGANDTGFNPTLVNYAEVNRVLVQPDGALIVAGVFEQIGNSPRMCIARLLDANVLAVRPSSAHAAALQAWPVPAHAQLHLRLEPQARPQQVQLLDALGRPVRTLAQPAADATLDVRGLPAGAYLLRVDYADGPATRRVVVK